MKIGLILVFLVLAASLALASSSSIFDSPIQITRDNNPKMSQSLYDLVQNTMANARVPADGMQADVVAQSKIRVFVHLADANAALPTGWGIGMVNRTGDVIEAWVPIDKLEALADLPAVTFVEAPGNPLDPFNIQAPAAKDGPSGAWLIGLSIILVGGLLAVALYQRTRSGAGPREKRATKKH